MKLAILDKDGTLVRPVSGNAFVQYPRDQELLPGVETAIARLASEGYTLAIATNQGGVAAGHKSLDDAIEEVVFCNKLLSGIVGTALLAHSYENEGYGECVKVDMSSGATSWEIVKNSDFYFRKPEPGMINWLAANCCGSRFWKSEGFEVLMIGDRPEDRNAAVAAGARFLDAEQWRSTTALSL